MYSRIQVLERRIGCGVNTMKAKVMTGNRCGLNLEQMISMNMVGTDFEYVDNLCIFGRFSSSEIKSEIAARINVISRSTVVLDKLEIKLSEGN